MPPQYSQSQIEQAINKLPSELEEAFYSLETAENIVNTCESYGILDERVQKVSELVGLVLLGLIPPQHFQENLEKKVGLPVTLAKAVSQDINRFVFYPVRPFLEDLHKTAATSTKEPSGREKQEKEVEKSEKEQEESPRKDTYREPIE